MFLCYKCRRNSHQKSLLSSQVPAQTSDDFCVNTNLDLILLFDFIHSAEFCFHSNLCHEGVSSRGWAPNLGFISAGQHGKLCLHLGPSAVPRVQAPSSHNNIHTHTKKIIWCFFTIFLNANLPVCPNSGMSFTIWHPAGIYSKWENSHSDLFIIGLGRW